MNRYHAPRRIAVACAALLVVALATAGSAAASSLVFVKNKEVWISSPDGSIQKQVSHHATDKESFYSPSQKDDGTIVASGPGKFFFSFRQDGSLPYAPVLQPTCGGLGFRSADAQVRPAGGLIAYSYVYSDCFGPDFNLHARTTVMGDKVPTISENIFPHWRDFTNPRWLGNDEFAMISLDGEEIFLEPDYPTEGGNATAPRLWLNWDTPGTADFDTFDYSRTGQKLMVEATPNGTPGDGDPPETSDLIVVRWNGTPPDGDFTSICTLPGFAKAPAEPRWSPDGNQIAWTGSDGVYVSPAPVAGAGGRCVLKPKLIAAGAKDADWGVKSLPTGTTPGTGGSGGTGGNGGSGGSGGNAGGDTVAPTVRLTAKKGKLSKTLRKGYIAGVRCNEACSITGQLTFAGRLKRVIPAAKARKVASGKANLGQAGSARLKLKFTRKAKKSLKRKRSVKLTLQVRVKDASGNTATRTARVTLKR